MGHDLDDVGHHGNVAEVLQHFDPGNDTVEGKNIFPHHDPKSGIIIRNINLVSWRETLRLVKIACLYQRPESTQVSDSEQSEISPVHNKPAASQPATYVWEENEHTPSVGSLVAQKSMTINNLQFQEDVHKNLNSDDIKSAANQHKMKQQKYRKKHDALQLNVSNGIRVDYHLAQAHNSDLVINHLCTSQFTRNFFESLAIAKLPRLQQQGIQ